MYSSPNSTNDLFINNYKLSQLEYNLGLAYLRSWPSYMTIVIGNNCNINCIHCYQNKNNDNLITALLIGKELRREFCSFYPFLSTLRLMGGEVFIIKEFKDLLEDINSFTTSPIISVSTNGTLLNKEWSEFIVGIPFQSITFSIDGATKKTYEKIRRGGSFDQVIQNIILLQKIKQKNNSIFPFINAFYVVMKSNYKEIPSFFELLLNLDIHDVTFQTILVDERNLKRNPEIANEDFREQKDVQQLYEILLFCIERYSTSFSKILWSGMKTLLNNYGFDSTFLNEEQSTLTPGYKKELKNSCDSKNPYKDHPASNCQENENIENNDICPNPWNTIHINENGSVSICFASEPIGNLYEQPLIEIWNNHKSISKRTRMLAGKYIESGCSKLWCGWRESKCFFDKDNCSWHMQLEELKACLKRLNESQPENLIEPDFSAIPSIRRILANKESKIRELESNLSLLWQKNGELHQKGQTYINHLENIIDLLKKENQELKQSNRFWPDFKKAFYSLYKKW